MLNNLVKCISQLMEITLHTIEDKIFFGLKIMGMDKKGRDVFIATKKFGSLIMHPIVYHFYPESIY